MITVSISSKASTKLSAEEVVSYIKDNMPDAFNHKTNMRKILGTYSVQVNVTKLPKSRKLTQLDILNSGVTFSLDGFDSNGKPDSDTYHFRQVNSTPASWNAPKFRNLRKNGPREAADALIKHLVKLSGEAPIKKGSPNKGLETALLTVIRKNSIKVPFEVSSQHYRDIEKELGAKVTMGRVYTALKSLAKKNLIQIDDMLQITKVAI